MLLHPIVLHVRCLPSLNQTPRMNDLIRREALLDLTANVDFDGATNAAYQKAIQSPVLFDDRIPDGLRQSGIHFE